MKVKRKKKSQTTGSYVPSFGNFGECDGRSRNGRGDSSRWRFRRCLSIALTQTRVGLSLGAMPSGGQSGSVKASWTEEKRPNRRRRFVNVKRPEGVPPPRIFDAHVVISGRLGLIALPLPCKRVRTCKCGFALLVAKSV